MVGQNTYKVTVGGTVAPSHTSGTATDGTVTWQYFFLYNTAINIINFKN